MTDKEMENVAFLLEQTWGNVFYKKDHRALMGSLLTLMGDCRYPQVVSIIKDYAVNYDNPPTVATLAKLANLPKEKQKAMSGSNPKYIEDNDGCGYMFNESTHEYDCIWKWWWAEKGMSKMRTLKEHGLIDY